MFRKILLAYDGSEGAKAALRVGIGLAKSLSAELHCISVEEELPHYAATMGEVEDAKDQAALLGIELHTEIRQGHEVEIIVNYAKEGGFDLLLAGYHGHSRIFERVMGSTAQSIIRLSPCSVLLAK
jgi:nucleotide-binding universal stress UspA family protein